MNSRSTLPEPFSPKEKLRTQLEWFAKEMEGKLRKNDHKGGWKSCTLQYLMMRLTQERKELNKCVKDKNRDYKQIIDECTDIANFAMMIADNFHTGEYDEL